MLPLFCWFDEVSEVDVPSEVEVSVCVPLSCVPEAGLLEEELLDVELLDVELFDDDCDKVL